MKFLEARETLDNFAGGAELHLTLTLSGSAEPFQLYARAAAAKRGRSLTLTVAPFGTLAQSLRGEADPSRREVMLLFPWDFVSEGDWRSGIPEHAVEHRLRTVAEDAAKLLLRRVRTGTRLLYVPAPMPPLFPDPSTGAGFEVFLQGLAVRLGARVVSSEAFSLGGYLASGCPVGGRWIGTVSEMIVEAALFERGEPKKVLVSDLDNVMWAGGIAEDGLDGIAFDAHGRGFRHFLYQTLLKRLRGEGVVIAAVSRNDESVARGPLRSGRMVLAEHDFVSVIASYGAKSSQIRELASRLNLGLDSFVFIDDNPLELAEVSLAVPRVQCLAFPDRDELLPEFLSSIAASFARSEVTAEDRGRTELYRRMLDGVAPNEAEGADLTGFLKSLGMTLTLHDRTREERTRAVQLINKTNQFNQDGRRISDDEVAATLADGGRLLCASLADRSGSHGEILACLIGADGAIISFVMSCRVFQRRVEYAFLAWLMSQPQPPSTLHWTRTPRNEPFTSFLAEITAGTETREGRVVLDAAMVRARCDSALDLFSIEGP